MGTNFYFKKIKGFAFADHIGKRDAAGWYCWDCRIPLIEDGICPKCSKHKPEKESLTESAEGRDLGFNISRVRKKTGVASYSSFTWAVNKEYLQKRLETVLNQLIVIEDENGIGYTWGMFNEVLKECPVDITLNIVKKFL